MRNRKEIEEIVFRILEPTNLIIDVKQDDAIEMITAWESLDEGHYDSDTISDLKTILLIWLYDDMKPVIDKFRDKLKKL